jgi:drug/metabolite transporter (DMT)-like permease
MRGLQITGAVLIVIGLWMIVRPPSYSSEQSVFKLGDIEAKMRQEHRVPGWVGGLALGAGVVLCAAGIKRR